MRAEVKDQAEESLSASVVAGGRGRKGGSFQSAGAEEAVIGAEGAGTPPHTHHIRSRALGPHCPAQAAMERLDSRSRGWDRHLNKSQNEHVLT